MDINSKMIKDGKFINMFETETGWEFVSRKKIPFRDGNKNIDAVIIVPIFRDRFGETRIVITKEYREPVCDDVYGFPAGLVDNGESIFDTAKRELKEETGLDCIRVLHSTPTLFSSEGLTDECISVIYIEISGELNKNKLQDGENIDSFILTRYQAEDFIDNSKNCYIGKAAYFIIMDFVNTGFNWLFENGSYSV